jgi:hypothetical protein
MDRLLRTSQSHSAPENYPEDQVILPDDAVVDIVEAEQVSDYKLRLSFSDGTQQVVDVEPFLRGSRNPMIRAYLEPNRFANFRIEYGELVWDDYGLCFPIADLYENRI